MKHLTKILAAATVAMTVSLPAHAETTLTVHYPMPGFFKDVMDVEFTAQMEDKLDKIEEGESKWADTVKEFYDPFKRDLDNAEKNMPNAKAGVETAEACPECGNPLNERCVLAHEWDDRGLRRVRGDGRRGRPVAGGALG